MRLANLGHAGFLVDGGAGLVVVDPCGPGAGLVPRDAVDAGALLGDATDVVLTSADPLHAHGPTLRALLPGRRLTAPARVLARLGRLAELATAVTSIAPFASATVGAVAWTALPDAGDAATTLVAQQGGDAVWFLGPAAIDRNRALMLADRLAAAPRRLAVISPDVGHLFRVLHGGARGFPEAAVADRIRTVGALRGAGFTVALAGGVVGRGAMQWADAFLEPVAAARLVRDLGLTAISAGAWLDAGGAPAGGALPAVTVAAPPRFDPSLGIPELPGDGPPVADLAAIARDRFARLRRDELAYGFHASLVEWGVRVEVREHGRDGERRVVLGFEADDVRVELDPPGAGTITIAAAASGLAALVAGDATAEELCLDGRLRTSERVVLAGTGVARPSWVGLQRPGDTAVMSARGHVLTPLALANLLSPTAQLPPWPDRWAGEQ